VNEEIEKVKKEIKDNDKIIENKNKKVAFVSGPLSQPVNGKFRIEGYKRALAESNIDFDESLVFEATNTYEDGIKLASQIASSDITAAFVANDRLAVGLLN
ncbi:catabolite control protein A, partial [Pediococcus acidilactici]|nr:catabolite control protein A [Pediococcus acidilactici]